MTPSHADDRDVPTPGATPGATAGAVPAAGTPEIRALDRAECEAVLRAHRVGRVAFAFERRVEILPLHYIYDDGWLYGRTSPGAKLTMWQHSRWVAFEVDEVHAIFDWTSVVVHGALQLLPADGPAHEAEARVHAVTLLRRLIPNTATAHDPVPERDVVFRIHADEIEGRTARSATPAG